MYAFYSDTSTTTNEISSASVTNGFPNPITIDDEQEKACKTKKHFYTNTTRTRTSMVSCDSVDLPDSTLPQNYVLLSPLNHQKVRHVKLIIFIFIIITYVCVCVCVCELLFS